MKTIYKYPLIVTDYQQVLLPEGAEILNVDTSDGVDVNLWALVDPAAVAKPRVIRLFGTGHQIDELANLRHLGTVITFQGALVWHVFEEVGQ